MKELIQARKILENSLNERFQGGNGDEVLTNKIIAETSLIGQLNTDYSQYKKNKNYEAFRSSVNKALLVNNTSEYTAIYG